MYLFAFVIVFEFVGIIEIAFDSIFEKSIFEIRYEGSVSRSLDFASRNGCQNQL